MNFIMTQDITTLCSNPTCFIYGPALIEKACKKYEIIKNGFIVTTEYKLGSPVNDPYYIEVWRYELKKHINFFALEYYGKGYRIEAIPIFNIDFRNYQNFTKYELETFIYSMLRHRRNEVWLQKDNKNDYDTIWVYVKSNNTVCDLPFYHKYSFEHNNQKLVEFEANPHFIKNIK